MGREGPPPRASRAPARAPAVGVAFGLRGGWRNSSCEAKKYVDQVKIFGHRSKLLLLEVF